MRRQQTNALADAVRTLVADPEAWSGDRPALAFPGLDRIPHGFENPAWYEFHMVLYPGDEPPLAIELARAIGMDNPSLAATDWPELWRLVDASWSTRHPGVEVDFAIKRDAAGDSPGLPGPSDEICGPVRVFRHDRPVDDHAEARALVLTAVERCAEEVDASGELRPPDLPAPWAELEVPPEGTPLLRVRRRWIETERFLGELERRGAQDLGVPSALMRVYLRYRGLVLMVTSTFWRDREWLASVVMALP